MQLQDELQVAYVQEFYQVRLPSRLLQGMFLHGEVPAACSAMITHHVFGCLQTVRDKCFGKCSCVCLADLMRCMHLRMPCSVRTHVCLRCSVGGHNLADPAPAEKCVTKPSTSLGSSEQQCLARCADRYSEVGAELLS